MLGSLIDVRKHPAILTPLWKGPLRENDPHTSCCIRDARPRTRGLRRQPHASFITSIQRDAISVTSIERDGITVTSIQRDDITVPSIQPRAIVVASIQPRAISVTAIQCRSRLTAIQSVGECFPIADR